jgi:Cu-Zn family superoxide dismutase
MWVLVIALCATAPVAHAQVGQTDGGASADVRDASGKQIAFATFRQGSNNILISLTFPDRSALTGAHAVQIHDVGRCDPPTFESAGRILNPFGKQHGLLNPDGPMAGDLAGLVMGPTGLPLYNISAPLVTLQPGPAAILRQGGTSLVVFDRIDDDLTQPEGNAGARIACGVIVPGGASQPAPALGAPVPAVGGAPPARPDWISPAAVALIGMVLIGAGVMLRQRNRARG